MVTYALRVACAAAVGAALLSLAAEVEPEPLTEAQVKAALLYNFASFVEWPPPMPSGKPIAIGIMGNAPVAAALRQAQSVNRARRTVTVRVVEEPDDPRQCQVLFMSSMDERSMSALLATLGDAPVLTVGEHERFTGLGGMIRIYPEAKHLRFAIDLQRVTRARLRISSRVLNLARIVGEAE